MSEKRANEERNPLFQIKNLSKYYSAKSGFFAGGSKVVHALEEVSFDVYPGETIGIVGESGCGKTTLGKTLLHLIEPTKGEVWYQGKDILKLGGEELRKFRKHAQIVYQDPYTSLNPRNTIGKTIGEPLKVQKMATKEEIYKRVLEMLQVVGLSEEFYNRYSFECSGGQRQRVGIARALIMKPEMIVCDEAVSALDVSTQSQIINLLEDIQKEYALTYLFISHGLSVVRHICSRVIVMYLGRIVEMAPCEELYRNPQHPYTQALFSSIPIPDPEARTNRIMLEGDVPNPIHVPEGCPFHTRCQYAMERCKESMPSFRDIGNEHKAACYLLKETE